MTRWVTAVTIGLLLAALTACTITVRVGKRFTVPHCAGTYTTFVNDPGGILEAVGSNPHGTRWKALAVGLASISTVSTPDNPIVCRETYDVTVTP